MPGRLSHTALEHCDVTCCANIIKAGSGRVSRVCRPGLRACRMFMFTHFSLLTETEKIERKNTNRTDDIRTLYGPWQPRPPLESLVGGGWEANGVKIGKRNVRRYSCTKNLQKTHGATQQGAMTHNGWH